MCTWLCVHRIIGGGEKHVYKCSSRSTGKTARMAATKPYMCQAGTGGVPSVELRNSCFDISSRGVRWRNYCFDTSSATVGGRKRGGGGRCTFHTSSSGAGG
jgi:hypothetical protein